MILFAEPTFRANAQEGENEGLDDAIIVQIEEGLRRVRVLVRAPKTGIWHLYSMAHLDGRAGRLKLPIPTGVVLDDIRVQTTGADPFPHVYYTGKRRFEESVTDSNGAVFLDGPYGEVTITANDDLAEPVIVFDQGETRNADPAEVVESDIWKFRGTTLYFFNQFRGLQVFDLANPSQPTMLSTLRLPAAGEDLYVLDDDHAVLLANSLLNDGMGGSELINVELGGPEALITLPAVSFCRAPT